MRFKRRDLYDTGLVALFVDAPYLALRRDWPKEGVLVACSPPRCAPCASETVAQPAQLYNAR
jgi:hypothetical protein